MANVSLTDFPKSKSDIILQLVLVVAIFLSSVAGNLCICIVLARYKKLRTIPNIFLLNLSAVNILLTVVSLPLLVIDNVLMSKDFIGKTASWVTVFLYVTLIILNVYSMVLMMLDRYMAIAFGIIYKGWTSKHKAFRGIGIVWILAAAVSLATLLSVWEIDLGDKPVYEYRRVYFNKAVRFSFLVNVVLSVFSIVVLSSLTFQSIKSQTRKFETSSSDSSSQATRNAKRLRNRSVAVKNIIIITVAYALCFVPGIIFSASTNDIKSQQNHWANFFIPLCIFFSNVIDPLVFITRSQTLIQALKTLYKTFENPSHNHVVNNLSLVITPIRSNIPISLLSTNRIEPSTSQVERRFFHKTLQVETLR